eukprot:TRINITY_DN6092_c0_g1_i1.p1 TRINITY_DN6092_c0_g1~~TRINITY_DN6092_c0_g1_i1.p1  ORF type:complete len:781 (+),score=116.06 TRINITY_DN6092_c0_g1_i1:23-2344(+)
MEPRGQYESGQHEDEILSEEEFGIPPPPPYTATQQSDAPEFRLSLQKPFFAAQRGPICLKCHREWSFLTRSQHQCRCCFREVCWECSGHSRSIVSLGVVNSRVCDFCDAHLISGSELCVSRLVPYLLIPDQVKTALTELVYLLRIESNRTRVHEIKLSPILWDTFMTCRDTSIQRLCALAFSFMLSCKQFRTEITVERVEFMVSLLEDPFPGSVPMQTEVTRFLSMAAMDSMLPPEVKMIDVFTNVISSEFLGLVQWGAMGLFYVIKKALKDQSLGEIKGMLKIAKLLNVPDLTTLKFGTSIIEAISSHPVNKLAFYSTGGVETLASFMDHPDFTVQHNVFGALINLAAQDDTHHRLLTEMRGRILMSFLNQAKPKIVESREVIPEEFLREIQILQQENGKLAEDKERLKREINRLEGEIKSDLSELVLLNIQSHELTDVVTVASGLTSDVMYANFRGKSVALKKFRNFSAGFEENWKREVHLLRRLRHPNLVLLLGICQDSPALVFEFMENGSLHSVLHEKHQKLTEKQKICVARDIALGMNFLHLYTPKILHRDLKSQNVLIDAHMHAKICDFGLSKIASENIQTMTGNLGTVQWTAPEILQGSTHYNEAIDIYSFAIVLWELATGSIPYLETGWNPIQIAMRVVAGDRPTAPAPNTLFASLITACWDQDPTLRPSFTEVLSFLSQIPLDPNEGIPNEFFCPISFELMVDPVITSSGQTYERANIENYLKTHPLDPITRVPCRVEDLCSNLALKKLIQDFCNGHLKVSYAI